MIQENSDVKVDENKYPMVKAGSFPSLIAVTVVAFGTQARDVERNQFI